MSEQIDRGIFATADQQTLRAMASYAGSHRLCRQSVNVTVVNLGSYSFDEFPTTIDGAIDFFVGARKKAPTEYRDALNVRLEYESASYDERDTATASLSIWYSRQETDKEMLGRFNDYMQYINDAARRERQQYETLRAKFGTQP